MKSDQKIITVDRVEPTIVFVYNKQSLQKVTLITYIILIDDLLLLYLINWWLYKLLLR